MSFWNDIQDWRSARRLWAGLGIRRRILVIPGDVANKHDPACGIGEMRSTAFLHLVLGTVLNRRRVEIRAPHEFPDSLKDMPPEAVHEWLGTADLILLGDGSVNPVFSMAIERLSDTDPWLADSYGPKSLEPGKPEKHWVKYRDLERMDTEYLQDPARLPPFNVEKDYGIFVVRPNCFSLDKKTKARVILLYGGHTYGTEAAAYVYFNRQTAAQIAKRAQAAELPADWYMNLDALAAVKGKGHDGGAGRGLCDLEKRHRVLAPSYLHGVEGDNPGFESALTDVIRCAHYSLTHQATMRMWMYFAAATVGFGLFLHSLPLIGVGAILFVLQKLSGQADVLDVF